MVSRREVSGRIRNRNREEETTALARCAFHRNPAAMAVDDPLDDRQTETSSLAASSLLLPETVEEARNMVRRNSGSRIRNPEDHFARVRFCADHDGATARREFDRVSHQIIQNLEEAIMIAKNVRKLFARLYEQMKSGV